jgi:integrase/recombinase XerC
MARVDKVKYCTEERIKKIPQSNMQKYKKYLQSSIVKNIDVKDTTFSTYENNFMQFLTWLANEYDETLDLYSEEFMDNAVDIMEAYMLFCQETLLNHKKTVNNKLAAVSTFYIWAVKRNLVKYHPFKDKLDRMKKASEEHIIKSYFLNNEQIEQIRQGIKNNKGFSIQDQILFELSLFSANRIGALSKLTITSMNLDEMAFKDIREKEGYHVDVPLDEDIRDLINEWLEMRKDDYDKLEIDALLIHRYDNQWKMWSRGVIHSHMQRYGEIIGLPDYHCHCQRKTAINSIYESTGDLNLASQWANHKSTAVTQDAYIKKTSKSELKNKIDIVKNRNKLKDMKLEEVITEENKE